MNDAFCYWFSGLADGESHLGARPILREGVYRVDLIFSIGMRSDDKPMLESIQATLGVGTISTTHYGDRKTPLTRWDVGRLDDLREVIVPLFRKYPLRSRKAFEFPIWAAIVEMVWTQRERRWRDPQRDALGRIAGSRSTWAGPEWDRVTEACARLVAVRGFVDPLLEAADAEATEAAPPATCQRGSNPDQGLLHHWCTTHAAVFLLSRPTCDAVDYVDPGAGY